MPAISNLNLNYNRPLKIADDVYWVGVSNPEIGLQANPYLIIDDGEAVLIDGGSRPEFASVMMKILQTGLPPSSISTLLYQHYDPDLCGSIPNLEDIIDRTDLKIISQQENNVFIRHYAVRTRLTCMETLGRKLVLASGRTLRFIPTPYAHSPGSFVTYDEKSGIIFSSDLFGSYSHGKDNFELFLSLPASCHTCTDLVPLREQPDCATGKRGCQLSSIHRFHRKIMTSTKALRHAVDNIMDVNPAIIAPQHGMVITDRQDIATIAAFLRRMEDVGIDHLLKEGKDG